MMLRTIAGFLLVIASVAGAAPSSVSVAPNNGSSTQGLPPSSPPATTFSAPIVSSASSPRVATLLPGQMYQIMVSAPLFESINRATTTKRYMIPAGGYFQCLRREAPPNTAWYAAQIWDGQGNAYSGYIDGSQLQEGSVKPYAPSKSAAPSSQNRSAPSTARNNNAYTAPAPTTPQGEIVYIAPDTGKKYHLSQGCRGFNNANQVISMSVDQARAQGYEPCKICAKGR